MTMYCNRHAASWLRMCADFYQSAESEFIFSSRDETSHEENAASHSLGAATLEGAQTETAHGGERSQAPEALPPYQLRSGDPQVCAPSFFSTELQPQEAVASVTRNAAPDVADKGAPGHHDRKGVDQHQPLLHGMESTAASYVSGPGNGAPFPGMRITTRALCRPRYRRRDLLAYSQDWIVANRDLIEQRLEQLGGSAPDEFDDFALVQHDLECSERTSLRETFRNEA